MDHRQARAAAKAVQDVDVNLYDVDPEPVTTPRADMPFTMTHKGAADLALRKKADFAGVRSPSELPSMPGVNALSFTVRYLPGGRDRFVELVKLAAMNGDQAATAWWMVYADLNPTHRKRINFDDVCTAAGVKPSALMAGVVGHAMEAGTDAGNLVAAVCHPEVIAAAAKSAMRTTGEYAGIAAEDRKQLLQARGFLPVPKGASIHVHANANAHAAAASAAEPSVPRFADDLDALSEANRVIDVPALPPAPDA